MGSSPDESVRDIQVNISCAIGAISQIIIFELMGAPTDIDESVLLNAYIKTKEDILKQFEDINPQNEEVKLYGIKGEA